MKPYQLDYTRRNPVAGARMYDVNARTRKAEKIVAVLTDYFGDTRRLHLLDLSCSTGIMAQVFRSHFAHVTGIDIDRQAIAFAQQHHRDDHVSFFEMDALKTEFPDSAFDVTICNQMYEHVPDPERMMQEIQRILKPGGICYFGATNRLKVIETHYGNLPFLSWLPKKLSHAYLRMLGKGTHYYENLMTCRGLKKLVTGFERIDYTRKILEDPERFYHEDAMPPRSFKQRAALIVVDRAYGFSPGYVWLLKKLVNA